MGNSHRFAGSDSHSADLPHLTETANRDRSTFRETFKAQEPTTRASETRGFFIGRPHDDEVSWFANKNCTCHVFIYLANVFPCGQVKGVCEKIHSKKTTLERTHFFGSGLDISTCQRGLPCHDLSFNPKEIGETLNHRFGRSKSDGLAIGRSKSDSSLAMTKP